MEREGLDLHADSVELTRRASIHEAGHVLADHRHGFYPIEVSVAGAVGNAGSGRTDCRDREATVHTAERFVISCLAGAEAERLIVADDRLTDEGAISDTKKAERVLPACPRKELSAYVNLARALVNTPEHIAAIKRIAKALFEARVLKGRALQAVIDSALGEPRSSYVGSLAVLRSHAGNSYPPKYLVEHLVDSLLVGTFEPLRDGHAVNVRGQNADDCSRALAAGERGDLFLEVLEDDGLQLPIETVTDSDGTITLAAMADPF